MMDETLIGEVAQHGVIYNRQKYYLNSGSNGSGGAVPKYETKEEAWQMIAMKMHTDVETVKKRWKYLRERYVSQRKQGDPPVYEHLSRPYLEKMKFLDQHIQPRKSYRNVPNFLTSPHSANSSGYSEFNMDSKSNGSMKNMNNFAAQHHYHQQSQDQHAINALSSAAVAATALENSHVKLEADQAFRDFAAAVASQQLHQISQTQQMQHQQQAAVAATMADSSHGFQDHFRDTNGGLGNVSGSNQCFTENHNGNSALPTSSSPLKSPLSSPSKEIIEQSSINATSSFNCANTDNLDSTVSSNFNMKKPRVQHNNVNSNNPSTSATNSQFTDDTDDDSDDNSVNMLQATQNVTTELHENSFETATAPSTSSGAVTAVQRNSTTNLMSSHHNSQHHHQHQQQQQQQNIFPPNADFLFQLYQQLPHNQAVTQQHFNKFQTPSAPSAPVTQQRCSEHLVGELVTTELLKMSKERRKYVQRRILEILFFDD